jgi:hypothetical protein
MKSLKYLKIEFIYKKYAHYLSEANLRITDVFFIIKYLIVEWFL